MDQKESLLYLTTKQFNLTEDEAKALLLEGDELKPDATDLILDLDKSRIQKLKDDRTKQHDAGYKKAEAEFKTIAETKFKELTGYAGTETNFEEMFKVWQETERKKWQKNIEINEDQVKKHPIYIALESTTIPKTQFDDLQKAFDEFKTAGQKAQVISVVTTRAWDVVAAANPILSDNPTVAENRKRDFLAKFSGFDYDLTDGKIIVSKDGKRLEDEHANHKPFEAFVMELAGLNFDFKAQTDKGNTGNNNNGTTGGVTVITDKPTTIQERNAALAKWNNIAGEEAAKMRIAINNYYKEHKKD
jgi:hypothetical protein